ncbi:hypothetical protein TELCIR_04117 [Teladorsagia circumcincta]|uniref:Uncharacterized protein n=1 Tax=Teladorsagia circumcincta TaxID=45464 RepID=A0A2G9UUP9_TELCI|nr:hypothetical protein TELCIR_04117 [Teladorsagia circumcincta]
MDEPEPVSELVGVDDVITDEDVADVNDDDGALKVNTAHYDGKKTTISISTEAGIELYQHWLDQAVSGLMATVATQKMRAKRSFEEKPRPMPKPVQMDHYSLEEENKMSVLALLAKKLVHTVRLLKHKNKEYKSWQSVISELREEGKKLKERRKARKTLDRRLNLFTKMLLSEGVDRSDIKKMDVLGEDGVDDDMEDVMLKAKEQESKLTDEEKMMQAPVKLIRQGLKLGMMLSGQNVSDFDKKSVKLISPRLFSLVPDGTDDDMVRFLLLLATPYANAK